MKLPRHEASLTLTHNDHKSYYQTVAQSIKNEDLGYRDQDWVSDEQKKKAIETNDCWYIQWYPDSPVGFCAMAAGDLDVLLDAACEWIHILNLPLISSAR